MIARFLTQALLDLDHAVAYYEAEQPGLGYDFEEEVFESVDRICLNPKAWAHISSKTRRCITHRFPYGVIYQIRDDHILVVGVMHLSRHPDSWRNRY